jgi:CSLREA domain-containing protein
MHPLTTTLPRILVAVLAAALTIASGRVRAETFVVNATTDAGDGTCGDVAGDCTLRDAILAAVATPGRDTIAFDPTAFPIGAPGVIELGSPLPPIADAAGTVLDGAGAGVVIRPVPTGLVAPGTPRAVFGPIDGIVFASAAGVPLENVRVANVTILGFTGRGLVVCGGVPPLCEEDVASTVLQNLLVSDNDGTGIDIRGRTISKTRIVTTVAHNDGDGGIRCKASDSLVGTRVERSTARDNTGHGFDLDVAGDAEGTVVIDSIAAGNHGNGIRLQAGGSVEKMKVTGSAAATNHGAGIQIAGEQVFGVTIANVTTSRNDNFGIGVTGAELLSGAVVKDVVSDWNLGGIVLSGVTLVTGSKITNAKATGNQNSGVVIGADLDVTGSKLTRITAVGNGGNGVMLHGSKNVLKQIRANGNHGNGISIGNGGPGNVITKSSLMANDGNGIVLDLGVTGAVVQKNTSFAHDGADLRDENASCDGNVWKQNVFETRNVDCIQ